MSHPYIAFIPGFQGTGSDMPEKTGFRHDEPPTGTNARIIYDIAHANGTPFFFLSYQSRENRSPLFSKMGDQIASQLLSLQMQFERAGLVITSGTGTAIALQALASNPLVILPDVISLRGTFDLVRGIEDDTREKPGFNALLNAVRNGTTESYPLALTPSVHTPRPGNFPVTRAHLEDPKLFHPLGKRPDQRAEFIAAFHDRKIPFLRLTGTEADSELAFHFRERVGNIISTQCFVDIVDPTTNGLITEQIKQHVIQQTLRPRS